MRKFTPLLVFILFTSFFVTAQPANDNCAGAFPLTNGVLFTMSTVSATSVGDPVPPCSTVGLFGKGVWFTYTPTADEEVMLQTCGSDFDTILQVFTGTCGTTAAVGVVLNFIR